MAKLCRRCGEPSERTDGGGTVVLSVRVPTRIVAMIDAQDPLSRSEFVRHAIERALADDRSRSEVRRAAQGAALVRKPRCGVHG